MSTTIHQKLIPSQTDRGKIFPNLDLLSIQVQSREGGGVVYISYFFFIYIITQMPDHQKLRSYIFLHSRFND